MSRLVLVLVLCSASVAFADEVDDAMTQLEVGELDAATALLESVTIRDRTTLVRVLEARARMAHATRDDDAVTEALRALDALEPDHAFGPAVPPELGERLRAMNTPRLSLSVESTELSTGLSLQVRVDDAAGLARGTRLHVRVGEDELATDQPSFALPLGAGGRVEVWAELLGDAGVVLERWGSADSPNAIVRAGSAAEVAALDDRPAVPVQMTDGRSRRARIRLGVLISGAIALVVGGVLGGVFYAKNNRDARLGQPVLLD